MNKINFDTKEIQKRIYQNKIEKNFNVTDVETEFLFLYGEIAEAFDAYKKAEDVGEELADIAIYLLGLAEITNVDLGAEIKRKMRVNEERQYVKGDRQGYMKRLDN